MSDHSEDGECSSSPKGTELLELLDDGCFVMDRSQDDPEDNVLLSTSDVVVVEEENGEVEDDHSSKKDGKKATWLKSAMTSVMTLNNVESKVEEPKKKDNRWKPQCFNCLGEHNMVACPEPKDFRRIRENRDAFNDAKAKDSRYSAPQTGSNGEFKPGRLSDNLQRALGIGPNDIPEFVYRMRRMGFTKGYPPGYLKNAIMKQTNPDDLLVFHSDHPELKDNKEEGNERPSSPTINSDKVIYYFGFNQTYRALKDREQFRVPPFQDFVSCLNEHVKKEFWEEKKREERKRKAPLERDDIDEKRAKKEAEDDDECMILEAPPPPPVIDMDEIDEKKEEIKEEIGDMSFNESSTFAVSTDVTPKSRRMSAGTPVSLRSNRGEGVKKAPSLDSFAKGIIPFHVDEPTPRTGFLQKMLKKIKDKLG